MCFVRNHETPGHNDDFPPEEAAPTLHYPWEEDAPTPIHVSELTPDPEATIELTTWARLYYQMFHLNPVDQLPVTAFTDNEIITVDQLEDSLALNVYSLISESPDKCTGRELTNVVLDIHRPGYVIAAEVYISLPESMPASNRFAAETIQEEREGLYMAEDGSGVAVRQTIYTIDEDTAERLVSLLRSASPASNSELAENISIQFEEALEQMEPGLYEACHRYFNLRKNLISNPETMLEEKWYWGPTPAQTEPFGAGLHVWRADEYIIFTPPGQRASDAENAFEFQEASEYNNWTKTIWDRSSLPDDFQPASIAPTEIEAAELAEILQEVPKEYHIYLAHSCAVRLRALAANIRRESRLGEDTTEQRLQYEEQSLEYIRLFSDIALKYPPARLREWPENPDSVTPQSVLGADLAELPPFPDNPPGHLDSEQE